MSTASDSAADHGWHVSREITAKERELEARVAALEARLQTAESSRAEIGAQRDALADAVHGLPVSDFMESFSSVREAVDLRAKAARLEAQLAEESNLAERLLQDKQRLEAETAELKIRDNKLWWLACKLWARLGLPGDPPLPSQIEQE